MVRALHPAFHQGVNRELARGNVLARAPVVVTLGDDALDRRRPVAPLVCHLLLSGHVVGMLLSRGLKLRADRQRRQFVLLAYAVMGFDHGGAGGLGVEFFRITGARFILRIPRERHPPRPGRNPRATAENRRRNPRDRNHPPQLAEPGLDKNCGAPLREFLTVPFAMLFHPK